MIGEEHGFLTFPLGSERFWKLHVKKKNRASGWQWKDLACARTERENGGNLDSGVKPGMLQCRMTIGKFLNFCILG